MFVLAIFDLTTSNLPWIMELTFQVPMQYCSLQHWTLLLSPDTLTTVHHFHSGSTSSFLLGLFLCSSLVAYWTPIDLRGSSFSVISFLPFCTVHGVLKARLLKWFSIPFSSGPCFVRILHHEQSVLHGPTGLAHNFIKLHKAVIHVIILVSFLWLWFSFCLPSDWWGWDLCSLPDGRDWLLGKLDFSLMGKTMLNKSLIQFSVDGWVCVWPIVWPEDLPKGLLEAQGTSQDGCCQCPWPCNRPVSTHAPTSDSRALTDKSDSVSCGVTAPFSWGTQVFICVLWEFVSPVLWKFCNQILITFIVKFPGNSQSLCWIPRLGSLLWSLELSKQWENFFGIIVLQFVDCPLGDSVVGLMVISSKMMYANTLSMPGLLLPKPQSLWQAAADPCLHRRPQTRVSLAQGLVGVSVPLPGGPGATSFCLCSSPLRGMRFDFKCDSALPAIVLPLLYLWTWDICSW